MRRDTLQIRGVAELQSPSEIERGRRMGAVSLKITRIGLITGCNLAMGCAAFAGGGIDQKDLANFTLSVIVTLSFLFVETKREAVDTSIPSSGTRGRRRLQSGSVAVYCAVLFAILALNAFATLTHVVIADLRAQGLVHLPAEDATRLEAGIWGIAAGVLTLPFLGILSYLIGIEYPGTKFSRILLASACAVVTIAGLRMLFPDPESLPLSEQFRILFLQSPSGAPLAPLQSIALVAVAVCLCGAICAATAGYVGFAAWLGGASRRLWRVDEVAA